MIDFRTMNLNDIDAGLSLCRAENWNQLARDWEIFLHLSPDGCRIGHKDDKVVGTVTTVRYQSRFSWIGMVLVDPESRRQGIGMQLLQESLAILNGDATLKLDATPAGREVYQKLGFVDEYQLKRMQRVNAPNEFQKVDARLMGKKDFNQLLRIDMEIFGADRQQLLRWIWEGAPEYAFMMEEKNQIQGFCFGRPGYKFTHIGPVIASKINIAKELLTAALQNCKGKPVILDALQFDPEWVAWLASVGFCEQRLLTRMYRGSNLFPGIPEKQYAILGPEFG